MRIDVAIGVSYGEQFWRILKFMWHTTLPQPIQHVELNWPSVESRLLGVET